MPHSAGILFVTDLSSGNAEIERAIGAAFDGHPVCLLADQEEALRRIALHEFETIFCASRSGALASTLFLNEVWKRCPNSARFLLDGFADPATVVRCLLGGHQFLETPLDENKLRAALERTNAIRQFVKNDRIQTLLSRVRTLPTKPTVYLEVMRELRSPEPSIERVAAIVAKDLGISTKLIQLVNSPFYGLGQAISEVQDAIVFLGLGTTTNVVMSIEAFSRFDKIKPLYFTADRVWKHSQALGDTAKKICRIARKDADLAGQAYLAALLHDIGKLTFAENFPDEYDALAQSAEKQKRQIYEVELEAFGASHADAGAYLLAIWGLPIPTVNAVSLHHSSFGAFTELTPATVIHLAEQMFGSPDPIEDIILRYPPELGLRRTLDELRLLAPLRMQSTPDSPRTRRGTASTDYPVQIDAPNAGAGRLAASASGGRNGVSKLLGGLARLWS